MYTSFQVCTGILVETFPMLFCFKTNVCYVKVKFVSNASINSVAENSKKISAFASLNKIQESRESKIREIIRQTFKQRMF